MSKPHIDLDAVCAWLRTIGERTGTPLTDATPDADYLEAMIAGEIALDGLRDERIALEAELAEIQANSRPWWAFWQEGGRK